MVQRTLEEIAAFQEKYADAHAKKAAKKQEKKEKYGNGPPIEKVEIRVPWVTDGGREIDLEKPPWNSMIEGAFYNHRFHKWQETGIWDNKPLGAKIIRTGGK